MIESNINKGKYPIRARSHLLRLLGDELIADDGLAIFELVKNGYDADATEVAITLNLSPSKQQSIIVKDNGSGMTIEDITGKWLELATNSKRTDKKYRSPKFLRRQLGEKGVGRIAALKLGRFIKLVTRSANKPEYQVSIDWDKLSGDTEYLEEMAVEVQENYPHMFFDGQKTGTRIEISGLRRTVWTRADLRKLYRLVSSLKSPFKTPDNFNIIFKAPQRESDLKGMLATDGFLENAIWVFDFEIDEDAQYKWTYTFRPPHWKGVEDRTIMKPADSLLLEEVDDQVIEEQPKGKKKLSSKVESALALNLEHIRGIGPISGSIYAFNRRSEVLKATGSLSQMKMWLDDQTGVRVYRDGVRVFTYGEPGDDWLGLNARRINRPSGKLGTNSVVAAVHLKLDQSDALREKTNREGFDHNEAFSQFQRIISSVFEHFQQLHSTDREALDNVLKGTDGQSKGLKFVDAIENLKAGVKGNKIPKDYTGDLTAIEDEFTRMRDVMVSAGAAGLNLAVIFHEVEREVDALAAAIDDGLDESLLKQQIDHIYQLLHGFAPLLKKDKNKHIFASEFIRSTVKIRDARCKFHKVILSAPILVKEEPDFKILGASNLLTNCLGNIVDNALYWARVRREQAPNFQPAILVRTFWDSVSGAGMIAVIDNGPGFKEEMPPDRATQAFTTSRPGGMGIGLYFANLVMEQHGGELTIHSADELRDQIDFPLLYDGAAVVMRFKKEN